MSHSLTLATLPGTFAVARLAADAPVPGWAWTGELASVTRTREELSIICDDAAVPAGVAVEPGYRCLRVAGTLVLGLTGIFAALTVPLAAAGIPIFAFSTFDTDWIMVKAENLDRAAEALRAAGHIVT
ncbi:MAG TPA: ACT domain-containing protein [Longimicrobium sp.]|nr:ACT domain-containing protein [Longimicrobium sp.]